MPRARLALAIAASATAALGLVLAFGAAGAYATVVSHAFAVALGGCVALAFADRSQRRTPLVPARPAPSKGVFEPQSLEHVRIAAQAAGIAVFDWNLATGKLILDESRLDRFSPDARAALGSPAEFVRLIVHPDDFERYTREMSLAVKEKTNFVFSYRQRYANGETRVVQLHGHVSRDANGRAVRMLGITLDMTAHVEATQRIEQQALEQQRAMERLDLATRAAGIGIWDMDLTTGTLVGDTNMTRLWEQRDKQAFPTLVDFLRRAIHADDLPAFEKALYRTMKHGTSLEHRYREIRPDGSTHHIQFHGKVFRDAHGAPVRFLSVTVNVDAQMAAQQALQEQTKEQSVLLERLNLATRVGGIGVWDWDVASDTMAIDAAIARACGLGEIRLMHGARAFSAQFVYEPDLARYHEVIQAAIDSGTSFLHRYRIVDASGALRHMQFHAHVFRDDAGNAARILGVTVDVSAEVQRTAQLEAQAIAERALRDRLNLATQTAAIGVWDMDLATRKISSDPFTQQLLGFQHEMSEQNLHDAIHPDDRHSVWRGLTAALADPTHDGLISTRHRVVRGDGTIRHIQTHIRAFRDADATARKILGVTWDVTAEVEHAAQLQSNNERVQSLLERLSVASKAAGISAWEYDLRQQKFVWVENRSKAFGLDDAPIEEYGDAIRTMVHPDDLREADETGRLAMERGDQTFSYRFRVERPDGTMRHLQSYAHVIRDDAGVAIRLLGATTDVTNEVHTTELLQRQAAQERELNARLAIATEAAGIGTFEIDLAEQKFLWVENPIKGLARSFEQMPTLEEYQDFVHPDDLQVLPRALRDAFAAGSTRLNYTYRAKADDGAYLYVRSHAYLLPNAQGKLLRLLGVSWDATKEIEAAQTQEQQAKHERMLLDRLSMATEAAGICSWEVDLDSGRFLWAENWLKALGDVAPDASIATGAFLSMQLHPDDVNVINDAIGRTLKQKGDRFSCRYRAIGRGGNIVHIQSHARLVLDEKGWAHRLLGVSWDITREIEGAARDIENTRRLQDQAQQQHVLLERLKLSSEAAGICSFEIDMERGVFLWSENPIRSLTEMDLREVSIEKFADMVMVPEDRHLFRDSARQALKDKRSSFSFRYRGLGRDGNIVYVDTHAHFVLDQTSGRAIRLLGVSWDTTKTVEAAEKLERQSVEQRLLLERLSIATQVADISSWELDLTKPEFLWIENPIKALVYPGDTEYTVAELQKRVHPDDRNTMQTKMLEAVQAGTDRISYRYRSYNKDGGTIHIQNFVKLTFDAHGRPISALGASWDVTREVAAAEQFQQQAEQLRIAERRLERASLSSLEGHWESRIADQHMWFSSSSHALLGFTNSMAPKQFDDLFALFHDDDRAQALTALRRHVKHGTPYVTDARLRCGNGEYRWFRHRGTAERDEAGNAITMSGSIHDIHEQKLAENALLEAQMRFERAINGTQDGLWELEANGTAWSSPRLRELLGYSLEEFPNSTNFLRDYLHPDDAEAVALATQAHFQQEHPYDVEIRLRTKSEDYRWYRARAKAERDANGRPLRMSGSLQDVTEARAAREELERARAEAEAASNAKSSFLANVSHEIRTPMNGIIGMTGLLLDTALDRTQRDYAQTIRGSADSLLIVINDILDFSKIEAGKLDIESLELDLRGNVEDVGGMMAFQAAAKNLELVVHVHPDIPDRVIGDPQRIRQCLINLVGNAIKFTRTGEIVIEVSMVGRREGNALVQFQVRDTGIGIAKETLDTLFQPFVQADASTTRHFGGTGLGLSIVRRLVEMMDGAVGVESVVGQGSTFWFTLPLEPAASATQLHQPDLHRLGRRVLIVDDHETNRRVLAGQLMHAGYEVSLAQTGTEALQLLRQSIGDNHPYDIVLADYQMEDMDGAALGERINADPHLSRARIVILTSLDRHGDIRRFASLGFAGYLTKPVRARELFECLDRVLAREAKEWHLQSQPMVTRGTLVSDDGGRRYEGHVLLVEDNPVNQKVAVRFLERMGCQVRVADNGAEGVKAYQESRFDLVLMDLQMPVMDGLTATQRIRELEAQSGHTTPIVALTANAMTGQLERCMEAGMDGFLTKPLEIERLHETLELYGLAAHSVDRNLSGVEDAVAPINLARLNEITDGDAEFAFELAATFISSGEQVLEEVQIALAALDRNALSRAAHKLKGASANIHAEALRELAYALETQAASVDQPRLKDLVKQLRAGFDVAAEFLRSQTPPPAAQSA